MEFLSGDSSAIGQLVLLITMLATTWASIRKSDRSAKDAMDMVRLQHDNDMEDRRQQALLEREERAILAADLKVDAAEVRKRLDAAETATHTEADDVRARLDAAANSVKKVAVNVAGEVKSQLLEHEEALRQRATENTVAITEKAKKVSVETLDALTEQTTTLEQAIENAKQYTASKAEAAYDVANHVNTKIEQQNRIIEQLLHHLIGPRGQFVPDYAGPERRKRDKE